MTGEDNERSEPMASRAQARRYVDTVLDELQAHEGAVPTEMTGAVSTALLLAQEALTAERTECRKETPYSELMLVGDSGGLHYECSHEQVHTYPL